MPKWQNSKIVLSWIFSRRSSLEAGSASLLSFPQKRSKTHSKTIIIIFNRSTTDHHLPHSKDQRHSQQMSHPTNPSSPQIPHLALALATNWQKTQVMEWQSKLCLGLYCLFFCYSLKYAEFDLISLAFFVLLFFAKHYLLTSQEHVCSRLTQLFGRLFVRFGVAM